MNEKQIAREWKRLNFEIFKNKPKTDKPYPINIVRRRELLLFAQVNLSKISYAQTKKDKLSERFETDLYKVIIKNYYKWDN